VIASLCVAVVFVALRIGARWFKIRRIPLHFEDIFIYGALVSFIITCVLHLALVPTYFDLVAVEDGLKEPYDLTESDLVAMLKELFTVQFFYLLTLWAVKWSLLFIFKQITEGLPLYRRIWWGMFIFSILTFIGTCICNFTNCSSMHVWFTPDSCITPRDARAQYISLWYSTGADLATDLMSTFLIPLLSST
jgi:hypothetical protein